MEPSSDPAGIQFELAADARPRWKRYWPVSALATLISITALVVAGHAALGLIVALPFFALVTALISWFDRSHKVKFRIHRGMLEITGDPFFSDTLPLNSLDVSGAVPVDLSKKGPWSLKWKTFGTSMPGYYAGEFTLRNGEGALVFVSEKTKALYIPRVSNRRPLIISVPDPLEFRDVLKSAAFPSDPQSRS